MSRRPYIPAPLRQQVAEEARHRCGYCLTAEKYSGKRMHVEHIIPLAAGGSSKRENLWLSCALCNSYKGSRTHAPDPVTSKITSLFNPRTQIWPEHFAWSLDVTHVIGRTACGRATVEALRLNNAFIVTARRYWTSVGWHPPKNCG
ncbi:MAG: HNH endonuclease signature motif containing protein [Chloroflexota bacterium]|nr:HNH endonuclease signature motif containing protein [Chloroflexota bacterium]